MRPVKLVFCGINSFSERTEIDFDKLIANGLFGIFGETGSGKSTILDCINFALYGNVDRSKKKTDIINYNCEQAEVEFEFTLLNGGERKFYRVERSIKKKNGLGKAMLYVSDSSGTSCIADNTTSVNSAVEDILGLNAEDFRKCIALPQGEFAQFVQCAPAERFKIIERLFSLSKYGDRLKERLAERESLTEAEYLTASGELSAYADVDENIVGQSKKDCETAAEQLKICEKRYEELKARAEKINGLMKSRNELESARAELEKMQAGAKDLERLRVLIKNYPQCKEICAVNSSLKEKRAQRENNVKLSESSKGELQSLAKKLEEKSEGMRSADYDGNIEQIKAKLAAFEAAKADISELAEADMELRLLRDKYRTAVLKCDKFRDEEAAVFRQVKEIKKKLDNCVEVDLEKVLEEKLKPAILRGEYGEQIVYFGDLRESIKDFDHDGELYKFLREEFTDRIKLYESKILSLREGKVDVEEIIKDFKAASSLREKLLGEYNAKSEELSACKQNCAVADNEAANLKARGEEQKQRFTKIKLKLDGVFGENCADYSAVCADLRRRCDKLVAERDAAAREIEQIKAEIEKLNLQTEAFKVKIAALDEECGSLLKKLEESLNVGGYSSAEECEGVMREVGDYSAAQEKLAAYEEKEAALRAKIAFLSAIDGIFDINEQIAAEINSQYSEAERAAKEAHAQVRLTESNYARLSEMLEKKLKNEGELKKIAQKRELVLRLKELIRNNKFLEYIAGEYLSDISKAASVTLLNLTNGRYFLTYDDNFYVGDNYNEGKKRGVNTLSGGETFLVSLSLALALSAAICHGSLKSIEFFFLDEGFGTLDESLVDTVMDSLEKLRSSNFTIGIISHVEELKHRIESKIIVNKATETHGSQIGVCV